METVLPNPCRLSLRARPGQHGFIHLTTLVFLLFIVVVLVMYRQPIQTRLGHMVDNAGAKVAATLLHLRDRVTGTLDNWMHGNFTLDGGGVMVQPGALDDLLAEQPDFAVMAKTLPPLQSRPIPRVEELPRRTVTLCRPVLNPQWVNADEAKALQAICTQYSAPAAGRCGSSTCSPVPAPAAAPTNQ